MAEDKTDRPLSGSLHPSEKDRRETEFDQTHLMPVQDTAVLEEGELAELLSLDSSCGFSKQEIDFALATSLIRGKHLSERRLRNALKGWTSFGTLSLCQFLQQRGELPKERLSTIQFDVFQQLNALESNRSWEPCRQSIAKRTSWLLSHLDPDGRVAKVLGLSQIPKIADGNEKRSFQAEYRLLRKLGQGGLGTVWLAIEGGLNRYVAIKEISGVSHHPATLARFQREAEITGHLDHPGIVPIHLLGRNEADGRAFYVMRFLGNRTLDDAIREYHDRRELGQPNPIAFHRLLTAFVSVCHAIAYAHSRRIIHRDLKPQNIALDDFGQVIVLDWGLAKFMGLEDPGSHFHDGTPDDADHLDVTLAGQVMGTPLYMAPEQAAGRVDEIDERTDVYGLGAILFAILTGYAPHERSSETLAARGQMASLLDLIIDRPLTRPRRLNSSLPRPLEAICLKAMATERHRRYGTATSLADDLQRWIANEPITAIKEPVYSRLRRWIAKHPRVFRTVTALCLIIAAGTVTVGSTTYQRVTAANHLKVQTTLDETRELKTQLTSQVQTLIGNVRFLSTLPSIQALVDARLKRNGEPENVWIDRLSRIYSGLLDVNGSYAAITFWIDRELTGGKPVRVESSETKRGAIRTDLTAFLTRHLPAMATLARGEIYVGIPGRRTGAAHETDRALAAASMSSEPVGRCMVAGVNVYDSQTEAKVGGVVIECDLERILRDHLQTASPRIRDVVLTDGEGHPMMHFVRGRGLRPLDAARPIVPGSPVLKRLFAEADIHEVVLISPNVCAAKVPLDQYRTERCMGLVVLFDP